jgi:asparagine synthase (glutamine-hydrolysing)
LEPTPSLPALEPLEIHSGMILGRRRAPRRAARHSDGAPGTVRRVLEELMRPALAATPCMVAFSGGRDSSAILALATGVARREGLADPIPLTFRYLDHPRTWETEWQELVVRHLGLGEWQRVEVRAELDVLGPLARATLRRHGLFWPPNAHARIPMLEAASGGSLLGGTGGDEVFRAIVVPKKKTRMQIVRSMPPQRALMVGLVHALPARWQILAQYRHGLRFPWLRPAARREVRRRFVDSVVERRKRHYLEAVGEDRYLELQEGFADAVTHAADVVLLEPFFEPRFLRALLAGTPASGFPSRTAAMEHFFGDLLPGELVRRTSKAVFTESLWGPDSRDFAARWNGSGLDPALVDPEALRRHWRRPRPDMRSATALQAAWLASGEA